MIDFSTENERVIAGKNTAPEIVLKVLEETPKDTTVLDIGPGNGRLKYSLKDRPDLSFIGLEYDPELFTNLAGNGYKIINGDAGYIPLANESIGIAVSLNTMHEVCDASSYEERQKIFQTEIAELSRVVKRGGEIVIFDGVEPDDCDILATITPINPEASSRLQQFIDTYKAEKIGLTKNGDKFSGTLKDVVLFQTKALYVDTPQWSGEQNQLYPFLKEKDMLDKLTIGGFEIVVSTYPKGRTGVDWLLNQYNISSIINGVETVLQEPTFPQTQIFIRAKKT